jgi:hypothetical protein
MAKRVVVLFASMIVLTGVLMLGGCPTQMSDDNVQRCCICLTDEGCLNDGTTTASCRSDITNDGTTDYDLDCQLDVCFGECDFL